MKKNFGRTLGTVIFTTIFLLFNFHFSSCKFRNNVSPINNPNLATQALDLIPAGSTILLVCTGNVSCDTSGTHQTGGGTKIIMECVTSSSIQANAAFLIKIQSPNGETIKFKSVSTDKD
jgi:hypothetical protein